MTQIPWLNWLIEQLLILCSHLGLFLGLIFLLFMLQRAVFLFSTDMFGGRAIYISAWLGTPIHEISHAVFCLLFGHKIQKVVLFNPDQRGTLGYVTHSYNNRNLWQVMGNFFIGIAPLFGGLFALYFFTWLLLDDAQHLFQLLTFSVLEGHELLQFSTILNLAQEILVLIKQAYAQSPLKVAVWAYACAAVSLHLSPSREDLKGALFGFMVFLILCLCLMLVNQLTADGWLFGWHVDLKQAINMTSMLSVIGILLASLLLLFLLLCRGLLRVIGR